MKEKIVRATIARKDFMRAEYDEIDHVYAMKDTHYHDECEVFLMIAGKGVVNIDGSFRDIRTGSLVIIPPDIPHRFDMMNAPSHTRVVIEFDPNYQADVIQTLVGTTPTDFFNTYFGIYQLDGPIFDQIKHDLREIVTESLNEKSQYLAMLISLLGQFMIHVQRDIHVSTSELIGHSREKLVNDALNLIHENISSNLSLAQLSQQLFVNKAYLSRIFKERQKVSVQTYINAQKVNIAKDMLTTTALPVAEIATKVGYTTSSYFSRVFRNETGMTPSQYRRYVKITDQLANDYHNRSEQSKRLLNQDKK